MDREPRSLSLPQQEALAALSRQAITQLELQKSTLARVNTLQPVEKRLQASSQELQTINWALDQSAIVVITDHMGRITYINDKFCEISQYSRAELLGQTHRIVNSGYHDAEFFQQLWATITQGKVWKGEIKNRAKDGSFYWVDTTIVPVLNAQGKPCEYVAIRYDISERKRREEERERFLMLSSDLLCVATLDGYFKRVNPAFETALLYTAEELLTQPFLDFVHPEDKAATIAVLDKITNSATALNFEHRFRCRDGSYKWLAWNAYPLLEEEIIYAVARDITKTKQTKATLLERSRLSTLEADIGAALGQSVTLAESLKRCTEAIMQHLGASGVGIWTVDPTIVDTNDCLCLNLQTCAGQLTPIDIFPQQFPLNHPLIDPIIQTQQPLSSQFQESGVELFLTSCPLIVESRVVGVIVMHTNQSLSTIVHGVLRWVANTIALAIDRAWAREALLSRREALLFQLASQIRNSLDLDTILNTAVTEIRNLLSVDCCHFLWCWEEQPNQISLTVTHEARDPKLPSLLGESLPPHLSVLAQPIRKFHRLRLDNLAQATDLDPETRSLLSNWGITSGLLIPLKTQTGQLGAIVCSHYDGPRVWSNHEIELLQAVVDQVAIAIEHAELFAKTRAAALAAQTQAQHLELALQELQQAESRLIQTEKMSSLGQMVAGVAHEINNPVNFITGNLSHATNYIQDLLELIHLYQQHYPHPIPAIQHQIEAIDLDFLIEDLPKILASMQIGADRIHQIVLSLRNFSRLDEAEMKPVNIHDGIDSTLLILHNRIKPRGNHPGITVVKEYGNLPAVDCYAGQLNQVFMNILSNAIDALEMWLETLEDTRSNGDNLTTGQEDTGLIPLSLASSPSATPTIRIVTEVGDDNQVIIRIRDNGPGMPTSVVSRIFDPFFTTKPVGKGTGLGLSISYQIVVEKHGGTLRCLSEPGEGSEFWIKIPITPSIKC